MNLLQSVAFGLLLYSTSAAPLVQPVNWNTLPLNLSNSVSHCDARGGCYCDCSWASPATCGHDDGSCCHNCCCSPGPPPPPTPAGPTTSYCPNPSEDFLVDYGNAQFSSNGWSITGGARLSSKASFNLLGGFVEFDMDNSGSHGVNGNGVNHNLYLSSLHKLPNCGINCYCDAPNGGCMELDLIEANGNCAYQTTMHTQVVGGTCDNGGGCHFTGNPGNNVHVKAEFASNGAVSVTVNGAQGQLQPGLTGQDLNVIANTMRSQGANIESSQWNGWVPGSCGGGDLGSSRFSISNLKVVGSVNHGPEPRKC